MNIKERVLHIAQQKNTAKTKFFKELGLSYANFKGVQKSSALSSDAIAAILSKYPDINPTWLVIGEGEMLRSNTVLSAPDAEKKPDNTEALLDALHKVIASQEKNIRTQELAIAVLEDHIKHLTKKGKRKNKK